MRLLYKWILSASEKTFYKFTFIKYLQITYSLTQSDILHRETELIADTYHNTALGRARQVL